MAADYDPRLLTDKDWVRLQIGDRGPTGWVFQNDEILAVLGLESNKWLAAVKLGEDLLAKGKSVVSKSVDGLSLSYGDSPESAYRAHLEQLRREGVAEQMKAAFGASHVMVNL